MEFISGNIEYKDTLSKKGSDNVKKFEWQDSVKRTLDIIQNI